MYNKLAWDHQFLISSDRSVLTIVSDHGSNHKFTATAELMRQKSTELTAEHHQQHNFTNFQRPQPNCSPTFKALKISDHWWVGVYSTGHATRRARYCQAKQVGLNDIWTVGGGGGGARGSGGEGGVNLKEEWLLAFQDKIHTHKWLKRTKLIRTKSNMWIFGLIPFFKRQHLNNS